MGEKNNTITAKTSAPNIQAIPPDDASYFNNYTDTYQYSQNRNAVMTIGVAYSSAATKIEATLKNGTTVETVEGVMGQEASDQGDKSVNLWSFKIPDINESQEGEWKLTDITLYGVYYNGKYYDETGVTVDLENENIHTKVVNYVYITVNGTSSNFNGYFMDDHQVSDFIIDISDYEGMPVQGYTITDLKLLYNLNASATTEEKYGYTSDNLSSVTVSGEGTLKDGSETEYTISNMNFQQAGMYDRCSVSFVLNGVAVTAGSTDGFKVRYTDGGRISEQCPKYEVTWEAPDIVFTATNPAVNTRFDGDTNGDKSNVEDVYNRIRADETSTTDLSAGEEGYYMESHYKASMACNSISSYTQSKATTKLKDAGTKFTNATFTIPSKNYPNQNLDTTYSYTTSKLTNEQSIGGKSGSSRRVLGNTSANTVVLEYLGSSYTLTLKHKLTVYNPN